MKIAKKAGCVGWLIGFESISEKSLISVGKKTNLIEKYVNVINKIHDYKMMVTGSFVFGFDGDTLDVFNKTYEFVKDSKIDVPDAEILTPYPGTPLYRKLEREGRILTKDWSKYNLRYVVFKPKNMSAKELFDNTTKLNKKFFSITNISKRIMKSISLGYYPFRSTLVQNLLRSTKFDGDTID